MGKPDKWVIIMVLFFIAAYLTAWIAGFFKHRLQIYIPVMNAVTGLAVITYWIQKQLRIEQHIFELREIILLCAEGLFVALSIYTLSAMPLSNLLKVFQYIVFAIHLISLLLFLIFMLTFKMTKLF